MKSSNKSSILTGTVLLLVAALFSFSLILQPLDFGIGGPGHNNILYLVGNMLVTVYGFCSILIPLFLFIAGISCFATKWTSQKTMRLLTAIIPFFTAVLTEKICRSIISLGTNNSTTIKIVITVVTGLMLIVIEILGAGVIAESVNQRIFYKNGKSKAKETDGFAEEIDYSSNNKSVTENSFAYSPIKQSTAFDKALSDISVPVTPISPVAPVAESVPVTPAPAVEQQPANQVPASEPVASQPVANIAEAVEPSVVATNQNAIEVADMIAEGIVNPETIAVADGVSPEELEVPVDDSFEALVSEAEDLYQEDIPSIEEYENVDNQPAEEQIIEETAPIIDEKPIEEPMAEEETEPANPVSIITQEEYAALINPDKSLEESEPEELEWPNLPPVPDTLPEDYIDDDDPAFDFPPADDLEASLPEIDLTSELPETEKEAEFEENNEKAVNESPYAAAKYVDSLLKPNPAYPFGITLHNQDETPAEASVTKKPVRTVPKYPTQISLDSNVVPQPEPEIEQFEDDYVEDPTLPEPDYFNMNEPVLGEPFSNDFIDDEIPEEKSSSEPTLSQDFFDIDMNSQEEDDPEEEIEEIPAKKNLSIYEQIRAQDLERGASKAAAKEPAKPSFSSKVFSVFSDMDADVRKEYGIVDKPAENIPEVIEDEISNSATASDPTVVDDGNFDDFTADIDDSFEDTIIDEPIEEEVIPAPVKTPEKPALAKSNSILGESGDSPELNPNANTAKNLTADELTDFFNAQQAENTPKTREIEGNLPTTNRVTKKGPYVIPSDLLTAYRDDQYWIIDDKTKEASINLKQTLAEFNIDADIIGIKKGPVVTMFELLPAPGVKLSKIVALQDNIALSLAASSVRIVAPIPGKQAVGIEVPNKERSIVSYREIIEMDLPEYQKMAVPVVLGKDILGKAQLIDLAKTPHMLIAGATGSGKSVCVNSLILSILYKRSFKDVKLILVDPKVVELKLYNNIPHLLTPVITEPKKALQALQWCLCEMERRYALLDGMGVRDISNYNIKIKEQKICTEKLPYIVVIIDEFADLMATSGKELESIVARLTAMARAVGIHLVLATQRPSVNVITGLIKANIPSRIAFMVASRTDSNIIIDSVGAEKLLGRGDMLYASAVDPYPVRIQGTFVSDSEVENVVEYVKQFGEPDYIDEEIFVDDDDGGSDSVDLFGNAMDEDPLYDQALEIVVQAGKASASYIQRRLKIGYNRAARLVEEMEERGIVGPANGSKPREIIHIP